MIVSRYLSEPDVSDTPPLPEFGSESVTRLNAWWRVIRRAVRVGTFRTARQPFDRLDFYTAQHPLLFKLRLYSVSDPKVNMWQGFTWETLRYWQDLMSGETESLYPVIIPNLEWLDVLEQLEHAEPFAD